MPIVCQVGRLHRVSSLSTQGDRAVAIWNFTGHSDRGKMGVLAMAGLEWVINNCSALEVTEYYSWPARTNHLAPPNQKGAKHCNPAMWPEMKRTGKIWQTPPLTFLIICMKKLPSSLMLAYLYLEGVETSGYVKQCQRLPRSCFRFPFSFHNDSFLYPCVSKT